MDNFIFNLAGSKVHQRRVTINQERRRLRLGLRLELTRTTMKEHERFKPNFPDCVIPEDEANKNWREEKRASHF